MTDKKDTGHNIRITSDTYKRVKKLCKEKGLLLGTYCDNVILNAVIKSKTKTDL